MVCVFVFWRILSHIDARQPSQDKRSRISAENGAVIHFQLAETLD
jgi:hypothetical protein